MSWPKAGVRLHGKRYKVNVLGVERFRQLRVSRRVEQPGDELAIDEESLVPFEDVMWINVEAAQKFNLHDFRVLGDGYRADDKLRAYQESRRE